MTALFQLVAEYRDACDRIADLSLDAQTLADTIEGERWPVEVKARNCGVVVLSLEAQEAALLKRAEQLTEAAHAVSRHAKRVREYLAHNMTAAGLTRIDGPDVSLSWRSSEAVEVEDESQIPADLMTQPTPPAPKPNKAAIKAAIKAGRDVPGARIESRRNLQIK